MRDLDRRFPCGGLPVERQQPVATEGLDDGIDRVLVCLDRIELRAGDPPPGVLPTLTEGNQTQEQLLGGPSAIGVHGCVVAFRPAGQRAGDPADRTVGRERQQMVVPVFEQLRQGELEERERPGLVGDVGDHLPDQAGFQHHRHRFRGRPDRQLELLRGQRRDRFGSPGEQLAEPWIDQWAIVEVRAERHDHPHAAVGVDGRHAHRLEEALALDRVSAHREGLLELIHDQDQLGVGREHAVHRFEQPSGAGRDQSVKSSDRLRRHTRHRADQLVRRMGAREHLRDEPPLRLPEGTCADRGDHSGPDHR